MHATGIKCKSPNGVVPIVNRHTNLTHPLEQVLLTNCLYCALLLLYAYTNACGWLVDLGLNVK